MLSVVITTINNPKILQRSIDSCREHLPEAKIIIVRQSDNTYPAIPDALTINIPYDFGLSYSRNKAVQASLELGYDQCLIMADSIQITNGDNIRKILKTYNESGFDLVGLNLDNRCRWEGTLDLIKGKGFKINILPFEDAQYTRCDIVRNFFIARTQTLYNVMWDNELKMREHEDFFWRYKLAGYKVCCSRLFCGIYQGRSTEPGYNNLRTTNMCLGLNHLMSKWGIESWMA